MFQTNSVRNTSFHSIPHYHGFHGISPTLPIREFPHTGWVQPDHFRLEKYSGSKASRSAGMTWTTWGILGSFSWRSCLSSCRVVFCPTDFTQKITFSFRGYNSRLSIYKTSYRGYNSTSLVGALVLYDYNVELQTYNQWRNSWVPGK